MRTLLLTMTILAIGHCGPNKKDSYYCDIASQSLDTCDGKTIKVTANHSDRIQQHPVISPDKQSYWDVNGRDWIFVSKNAIDCKTSIVVTGRLDAKVGPCDPTAQNHNQYCGTAVYVDNWKCQ